MKPQSKFTTLQTLILLLMSVLVLTPLLANSVSSARALTIPPITIPFPTPPITPPFPSPTPTPTPVPSPSPTPTPAPTPAPTPTPSPTLPPMPHQTLTITTRRLPTGRINYSYRTLILAYQKPASSIAPTLTFTGLPSGLTSSCHTQMLRSRNQIICTISGKPLIAGNFPVEAQLSDNQGRLTSKTLNLIVKPSFIFRFNH